MSYATLEAAYVGVLSGLPTAVGIGSVMFGSNDTRSPLLNKNGAVSRLAQDELGKANYLDSAAISSAVSPNAANLACAASLAA